MIPLTPCLGCKTHGNHKYRPYGAGCPAGMYCDECYPIWDWNALQKRAVGAKMKQVDDALEFIPDGEAIPYDLADGIVLEARNTYEKC